MTMSPADGQHARVAQLLGVPMLAADMFLSLKPDRDVKIETVEQAREIASKIDAFDNMQVLELCMNSIGLVASQVISRAIANKPELKACLFDDIFKQRTIPETGPALKNMLDAIVMSGARIVYLNLSDNALGPSVIDYYQGFLESDACFSLQYLSLNNCGMGRSIVNVCDALVQCQRRAAESGVPYQLRTVIAGRNRLEDPGAVALARAFKQLGTLHNVSLPQDGIRPAGVKALAKSFAYNKELRTIDLADNCFNVSGAKAMCHVLPKLHHIEVLNFADCLFKTEGGNYFLTAMRQGLDQVREINLSGNEITANVARQLLDCVLHKAMLKQVKIGTNRLGRRLGEIRSVASSMGQLAVDVGESSDNEETESDGSERADDADESSGAQSDDEQSDGAAPLPLAAQIATAIAASAAASAAAGAAQAQAHDSSAPNASQSLCNGSYDEAGESYTDEDIVVDDALIEEFLDNPCYESLMAMHSEPVAYLMSSREVESMLYDASTTVDLLIVLSSVITAEHVERVDDVGEIIDTVLEAATLVNDEHPVYGPIDPNSMIVNHLVARLGFIKAEKVGDTERRSIDNHYGLFKALQYVIHSERQLLRTNYPALRFWFNRVKPTYDARTHGAMADVRNALDAHANHAR